MAAATLENEEFAKFLTETSRRGRCRVDLMSYLIMPCQRAMRYPMLVEELLKHTSELHEDHSVLVNALAQIRVQAKLQNDIDVDSLATHHHLQRVMHLCRVPLDQVRQNNDSSKEKVVVVFLLFFC